MAVLECFKACNHNVIMARILRNHNGEDVIASERKRNIGLFFELVHRNCSKESIR